MSQRPGNPPPLRLLLVDDNKPLADAILRLLGRDFDAVHVADGEAARETLAAGAAFDVVLSDVVMPRMHGLALLRWVERERPSLLSRLVFMTAEPDLPLAKQIELACGRPLLLKPCTREALLAAFAAVRPAR